MEKRKEIEAVAWAIIFLCFWRSAISLLSPKGVNFEVQALMVIKASLRDPHGVLENWDGDSVDPCGWTMVTCSAQSLVIDLGIPSQKLSGALSPIIGNLTNLQIILLQNNNITGPIPDELGKLLKLQALDLSNNHFNGNIPLSLGQLNSLQYMRFNNNSLSGEISISLSNMTQLSLLDLSYNNLSGPVPRFPSKTFNIIGNPLICMTGSEPQCAGITLMPISLSLNTSETGVSSAKSKHQKLVLAFGTSLGCICYLSLELGCLYGQDNGKDSKSSSTLMVKKLHKEKKLYTLVDKDFKNNYDRIELEEMVKVALLCTQYLPGIRPKMSEIVRMLEGAGVSERWESSQRFTQSNKYCNKTQELSSSN